MVARCEWINVCKVMRTVLGTSRMLDVSYVQYNRCCSSHRALIVALLSKRTGRRLTLGPVLDVTQPIERVGRKSRQLRDSTVRVLMETITHPDLGPG